MPTETPAPVPGDIVLEDSFSGPGSEARWLLAKDDDFSAVIENGKLMLSAANADGLAWAYSIEAYSGMDLEVEATILRGKSQAMFGISFGLEPAGGKGAVCLVRGDGFAVCGELVDDEPEGRGLIRVEVAPEGNSNPIRLVTVRDQWALHVNGQCVGSGQREAAQRGQVALLAGTDSDSASSQIAYDDLVIRVPDKDSEDLIACEPAPYSTEPSPGAGERRETAQPPEPEGNGTIYLSSETTAVATCRLSVWGGSVEDLLLDAGPGHPASRVVPAGQYSWQMHFGPRGRTDAATMQLAPGGSCSFTCYDDGVDWGCSR